MRRLVAAGFLLFLAIGAAGAQFAYKAQSPLSAESFRIGVEAYGKGRFAESLSLFERALSAAPEDPLFLYWLGKSYFRLGLLSPALSRWEEAIAAAGTSTFIESRLELAGAMADPLGIPSPDRYVRVDEIAGKKASATLFSRPSWIEPLPDGSVLLVSHGTDTVLQIDANARIIRTMNAGSTGFDRPFACAVIDDGTIFVTEFQADRVARISPDGLVLGYSGDATGPGRLSGPQYIAADSDGFVYVVDVGFSRVVKYDRDGSMVLSFGARNPAFEGFKLPTGIACMNGRIYVADSVLKAIFTFDSYGNFVGRVEGAALERPEGIRIAADGKLLVADGSRVLLLDPETGAATQLYRSERKRPRIVSAAFDANGELLVADFDASELAYLSDPATRFAGLSVEIGAVYSDAFPRVVLDVVVKDRLGRPLTGLGAANFYVSEGIVRKERRTEGDKPVDYLLSGIRPADGYAFEGSLDSSSRIDLAILLEASPAMASLRLDARDAVAALYSSLGSDASARIVVAGKTAQPAVNGGLRAISDTLLRAEPSEAWRFDSGLRLAAGSLFETGGRRVLAYVGSGSVNETALDGPSLSELASILANNGITFYAVVVGKGAPAKTLSFLAERTGGAVYRADRPEGLAVISERTRAARTGMYRMSYQATADDGFGQSYLPLAVEVYLRDRSGKDESGFFAPLR